MALFKKKTTLVHHVTYMGLMAAINVAFIALATFVAPLMFLLILILPFASTIVSYYCLKRYYLIYAVASVGLCLLFNPADTIFYVVPAIITGFVLGVLLENQIHPFWLIMSSTIINAGLTYAFIPLINLISGSDIVTAFLTIIGLNDFVYRNEIVFLLIFTISLMQCVLTNFVLLSDAKKIGIIINTRIASFVPYIFGLETSILLSLIFGFFYFSIALVFLAISFCFALFIVYYLLFCKKIVIYVLLGVSLFSSIVLFAVFYSLIIEPYGIILCLIFPMFVTLVSFINIYLPKRINNI